MSRKPVSILIPPPRSPSSIDSSASAPNIGGGSENKDFPRLDRHIEERKKMRKNQDLFFFFVRNAIRPRENSSPSPMFFNFCAAPPRFSHLPKMLLPIFPWELERMDGHHRKREGYKNKRRNAMWEQKGGKCRVYCPARAYVSASSLRRRWSRKRRKKKKKAPLFSILLSLVLPLPRRNTSSLPRKQK